ncbi:spore coat protein SP65-like [Embiotoca jacksoni]|uniref:spore coat protein SP65-like n=1 Tax=Embiotoca jacksoni TaxID=100190 RepID=UPI003704A98E
MAPTATGASTAAPTMAPTATGASTAPAVITTVTTATNPASTDPPTSSEGTLGLQFSLDQTFTPDLAISSSTAFKTLAATVVEAINVIGKRLYGTSFLRSIVNSFQSGSVVVNMTLVFNNRNSVPSASTATSQFSTELSSSSLNVIPGSVSAQSTSSASSSPPRPTMGTLAVFSLTLLAVAQRLIEL